MTTVRIRKRRIPDIPARELYPVPEAAILLGTSVRNTWDLVWSEELETRWLGGRRLVPREAIKAFKANLPRTKPNPPKPNPKQTETAA